MSWRVPAVYAAGIRRDTGGSPGSSKRMKASNAPSRGGDLSVSCTKPAAMRRQHRVHQRLDGGYAPGGNSAVNAVVNCAARLGSIAARARGIALPLALQRPAARNVK